MICAAGVTRLWATFGRFLSQKWLPATWVFRLAPIVAQDMALIEEVGITRKPRYYGSSELSMVRGSSVWSPSIVGKHDSQPVVIKVCESVG
jgi:hypothetical protein